MALCDFSLMFPSTFPRVEVRPKGRGRIKGGLDGASPGLVGDPTLWAFVLFPLSICECRVSGLKS